MLNGKLGRTVIIWNIKYVKQHIISKKETYKFTANPKISLDIF
jgi:hypothetical protein